MKKLLTILSATSLVAACGTTAKQTTTLTTSKKRGRKIVMQRLVSTPLDQEDLIVEETAVEVSANAITDETTDVAIKETSETESSSRNSDRTPRTFDDIDWSIQNPYSHSYNATFYEAAFLGGYTAASYLSQNADSFDTTDSEGLKIGIYGGQDIHDVTVFMAAYQQGVKFWNNNLPENGVAIELISLGSNLGSYLSGSFERGGGTELTQQLLDAKADVILPLSGAQVQDTLELVSESGVNTVVVGVDQYQHFWLPTTVAREFNALWNTTKDDEAVLEASRIIPPSFEA